MAYGIDSYSQSVASNSGLAVHSVLAHGLDYTYPKSHLTLRKGFERNGFTFSEYPIQSLAQKGRFLARNRLIAGIADVVWVVESAERGGSLVTANFAKDYNSHLVASPGEIHQETSQVKSPFLEYLFCTLFPPLNCKFGSKKISAPRDMN